MLPGTLLQYVTVARPRSRIIYLLFEKKKAVNLLLVTKDPSEKWRGERCQQSSVVLVDSDKRM